MKTGFEKEFSNIQSGLIALCLEAVEKKVDCIYAYAYIGEGSSMFNFFYDCEGSIMPAHHVIQDKGLLSQVMKYGTNDLESLRDKCVAYEVRCPMEMKMYYNCTSKKFSADYIYSSKKTGGFSPASSFLAWRNEVSSTKQ